MEEMEEERGRRERRRRDRGRRGGAFVSGGRARAVVK